MLILIVFQSIDELLISKSGSFRESFNKNLIGFQKNDLWTVKTYRFTCIS